MLTIVIGTYNRLPQLERCIESILKTDSMDIRIIVADAGSDDGTCKYLADMKRKLNGRLEYRLDGEKLGQARSLNRIFPSITSEYICWLSDDNELTRGILEESLCFMNDNTDVGLLGLKVKDVSGTSASMDYIGGIWPSGVFTVNQGIIRNSIFRELGYFDEEFRDYGIDGDLTTRVLQRGYKVALTRRVAVLHHRNYSDYPGAIENSGRNNSLMRALKLYRLKYPVLCKRQYGFLMKGFRYILALFQWSVLKIAGYSIMSRDVKVVSKCRYIKAFDLWNMKGKSVYLIQSPVKEISE